MKLTLEGAPETGKIAVAKSLSEHLGFYRKAIVSSRCSTLVSSSQLSNQAIVSLLKCCRVDEKKR